MTSKKHHASQSAQARPAAESVESRLDEALEESFPASDPVAIDLTDPHRAPVKEASTEEKKPGS
jgi:hypothetical protein